MKWPIVDKSASVQPKHGTYRDWKPQIAEECDYKCVYCAVHEAHFGGIRNFHVEHYRPRERFRRLKNKIKNLYYSCCICNGFKSDDWPGEPTCDHSNIAYCDPGATDFNAIFKISNNGVVRSTHLSCKYMIEKLYLNRPQLIMLRKYLKIACRIQKETDTLEKLSDKLSKRRDSKSSYLLNLIVKEISRSCRLQSRYHNARPYSSQDIKRQHGK